ncbi:MAG: L-2-amino-thiazoline-4-carboxylic acid hydrolase [Blautia sp.]|nr:L-2-amino-thiazoline-4-carboxylic acid hydrolase [Blautia sp.]
MKLPKGTKLAIRQALEITHYASEINAILTRTQTLYNSFIREAPAPGGMNLLRSQYYGGLSVFAFYEAMDRNVETDVLQEILWRMLLGGGDIHKRTPIRFPFSGTRLQRLAYAVLQRYASFANKRVDSGRWINTWKFAVNPEEHKNGISMPLMNCPVAAFAKKHGHEHLMPLFCGSDFKVAERYGMRLIREHTEAEGFPDCDFWYLMADDAER